VCLLMWRNITSTMLLLCTKQHVWFNKLFEAFHNTYISSFSKHLLENQHSVDNIENAMEFLYATGMRSHLNMLKKFYICKETKQLTNLTHSLPLLTLVDLIIHA